MGGQDPAPGWTGRPREEWHPDPDLLEQRLVDDLVARGVNLSEMKWLSLEETGSVVQYWMGLGAQRYGRLALVPADGSNVRRGEFPEGELPIWLCSDPQSREVFISFSRPASGRRKMARSTLGFAVDNMAALARADGDGFAAVTSNLEGVLLVNVSLDPGSPLEIDAWGDFVRELPEP
jgi:hypothetical protein